MESASSGCLHGRFLQNTLCNGGIFTNSWDSSFMLDPGLYQHQAHPSAPKLGPGPFVRVADEAFLMTTSIHLQQNTWQSITRYLSAASPEPITKNVFGLVSVVECIRAGVQISPHSTHHQSHLHPHKVSQSYRSKSQYRSRGWRCWRWGQQHTLCHC